MVTGQTATTLWGVGELRLGVRSAEGVWEVSLWGGSWELSVSATRGLQQGGLWALVGKARSLGDGLLWACIRGRVPLVVPPCTADRTRRWS